MASGVDVEVHDEPLAAVRRALDGAKEALLGVAFVQRRSVREARSILGRSLQRFARCSAYLRTFSSQTRLAAPGRDDVLGSGIR
jgi:hypothetical protein